MSLIVISTPSVFDLLQIEQWVAAAADFDQPLRRERFAEFADCPLVIGYCPVAVGVDVERREAPARLEWSALTGMGRASRRRVQRSEWVSGASMTHYLPAIALRFRSRRRRN